MKSPKVKRSKDHLTHKKASRLGDPVAQDPFHSCMTCMRFNVCKDPSKAWNYRCTRWQEIPVIDSQIDLETSLKEYDTTIDFDAILEKTISRSDQIDLEDMVEKALADTTGVAPDLLVDDRDLPTAPNFYEWMQGKNFVNSDISLFPRQNQILTIYQGEYCPRCSNMTYLDSGLKVDDTNETFLENVQLLNHGVCPSCGVTKTQLYNLDEINEYYFLNGCAGQRSGKTLLVSANESYNIHKWVKLPNPQSTFGVMKQQLLSGTYVALDLGQVMKNLWIPLMSFVTDSPFFKNYHKLLDYYGEQQGQELYNLKEIFLRYRHRRLLFTPSGPNKRTLRGRTSITGGVDEIGWFPFGPENSGKTRASAEEVVTALENAMTTMITAHEAKLRNNGYALPKPMFSLISSPSELRDMIMTRYRASIGSKTMYGFKYPTWEFNPTLPRDSVFIRGKFAADAVTANRDFGCEPPASSSAWVSEIENVKEVFNGRKNIVALKQKKFKSKTGSTLTSGNISRVGKPDEKKRLLTIDPSWNNNSFSFALSRWSDDESKVLIEGMGEIIPSVKAPISFTNVYTDVLVPLCQEFNVRAIISDRWQNKKLLQDLEEELEVLPLEARVKYEDFDTLRDNIYNSDITIPRVEDSNMSHEEIISITQDYPVCFMRKPVQHLLHQMFSVRDYPGKTVDKGSDTTDDLFRCVVLAVHGLNLEEVQFILQGEVARQSQGPLGIVSGFSSNPKSTGGSTLGATGGSKGGRSASSLGASRSLKS